MFVGTVSGIKIAVLFRDTCNLRYRSNYINRQINDIPSQLYSPVSSKSALILFLASDINFPYKDIGSQATTSQAVAGSALTII